MYPPLCIQAGGGSRGRSTPAAGSLYYHSQSAGAESQNGKSHFLDDSTMDFVWHSVQSPKVLKQSKAVLCNTSISMVDKPPNEHESLYHEVQFDTSPGIFDIHAIDTELLSEDAAPDWLDSGYPYVPVAEPGDEEDTPVGSCSFYSPGRLQSYMPETFSRPVTADKERSSKDSLPAKIKVVVRKRPINKRELARNEEDIICVEESGCCLTVHEPKLKVDLTAYVERHEFVFDAILDQDVTNEQVYLETVEPIIPTLFQRTKATCFAYGQTGSGKTYTMQPLPLKASEDILYLMQQPSYHTQGFQLWLSFFEIYGGKLFDLLNDRRKLCMREDGRQQVCIVGLEEFQILDLDVLKEFIEKGSSARSTGSTGANEESSRSHAILQLSIKKSSDKNNKKRPQMVGKISFIDLAGSERGADTTDNDRQTRLEGAEINKSLLALKECIRALDSDQGHIPFRGSKLTEVLRDSFVGDSRTVMISCISPSSGSCEHTLNTLRYADRVKGLSRNSNSKKDLSGMLPSQQESSSYLYAQPTLDKVEDGANNQEEVVAQLSRPSTACAQLPHRDVDQYRSNALLDFAKNDKTSSLPYSPSRSGITEAKAEAYGQSDRTSAVSLPAWNGTIREAKMDARFTTTSKQDVSSEQRLVAGLPKPSLLSCSGSYQNQEKGPATDRLTVLLKEEDNLVSAHCKELEQTIDFVREEMKLLSDIDQPGSQISEYVSQLSKVLSKKAAGLVNLQAHLARFQKLLKEQEIPGIPTATTLQPA